MIQPNRHFSHQQLLHFEPLHTISVATEVSSFGCVAVRSMSCRSLLGHRTTAFLVSVSRCSLNPRPRHPYHPFRLIAPIRHCNICIGSCQEPVAAPSPTIGAHPEPNNRRNGAVGATVIDSSLFDLGQILFFNGSNYKSGSCPSPLSILAHFSPPHTTSSLLVLFEECLCSLSQIVPHTTTQTAT